MNSNDNMITYIEGMMYAMEGKDPSKAIENQERRGQQSVVRNRILPKKINVLSVPREVKWNGIEDSMEWEEKNKIITQNNIEYTKQQYERMGIIIVEEYDDLFWNVTLPDGWEIKATNHSMWNNLFDDKGRKRAEFFYKAAFYDRDAFINFNTRFRIIVEHVADIGSEFEVWKNSDYQGILKDGEEIIFTTECVPVTGSYSGDEKVTNTLREQLEQYMKEHYPDYEDIHAYWEE